MVESILISVHTARTEENGGPIGQLAPVPSVDIYIVLDMINQIRYFSWSVKAAWTKPTSHICSRIDAHRVSDSIWRDVSLRQPRKEDIALAYFW